MTLTTDLDAWVPFWQRLEREYWNVCRELDGADDELLTAHTDAEPTRVPEAPALALGGS